ncbi:MAG: hypothetical protein ACLS67_25315, partial [Anaerobutyricum soehngenii]
MSEASFARKAGESAACKKSVIKFVFHGRCYFIVYLHTSTAYGQQLFIRQIIILIPRIKRNL